MKKQTLLLILCLFHFSVFSQNSWTYTKKDGLISDKVSKILVDINGNILILTNNGISLFDGSKWISHDLESSAYAPLAFKDSKCNIWISYSFASAPKSAVLYKFDGASFLSFDRKVLDCKRIDIIAEDKEGRIWLGGVNIRGAQVNIFDGSKWYNIEELYGIKKLGKSVSDILTDLNGNIWVFSGYIYKIDGENWTNMEKEYNFSVKVHYGLRNKTVLEDSNGNIWVTGHSDLTEREQYRALLRYNGNNWDSYVDDTKWGTTIYHIMEDHKNNIWFFSNTGSYIFYDKLQSAGGIQNHKVHSVAEDRNANIWVVTDAGIAKCENTKWSYFTSSKGFGKVKVIFEDSKGNIWFGGSNLYLFKNNEWVMKKNKPGLISTSVNTIAEDHEGNIWIGTNKGVIRTSE